MLLAHCFLPPLRFFFAALQRTSTSSRLRCSRGRALLIGNPLWSELCSIFSFWRCRPDNVQHRRSPWLHPCVCSITTRKWNTHSCLTDRRYASPSRCAVSLAWGSAMSFVPNTTSSRYVSQTHQRSGLLVGLTMYRSCIVQYVPAFHKIFSSKNG